MKKQERGITLIALVVTIVVLLILAAVSISMLGGENGIITQAIEAKDKTTIGEEKEAISVSYTACKTKDYSKDVISSEEMQEEINKIKNNVVVSMAGDDLIVYFQDTEHGYIVNQNGQISETDLNENSIIDMIDANIAVTLSGKVIYIDDSQFTQGQLLELNIEDYTVITENGVRKAGEGIFVDNEGKVYTWGENEYGQLGDGANEDRNIPICISDLYNDLKEKNIVDIYGGDTVIALDDTGKVYTWGSNSSGQLGDGTNNNSNVPICISELENDLKGKKIVDIYSDGYYIIICLDNEGKVYTCGNNYSGQLGDGTNNNSNVPICISELENDLKSKKIVDIYNGIVLDNTGKVYTWGYNQDGQLGDGSNTNRNTPICISELENDLKGKSIVKIYPYNPVIVLDNKGKVYTWGNNNSGQLGDGSNTNRNTPICISELENDLKGKKIVNVYLNLDIGDQWNSIIALDNEGKVYTWGDNDDGQLGDGTNEDRNTAICISELENDLKGKNIVDIFLSIYFNRICLDNEGKLYTWGNNQKPICISNSKDFPLNGKFVKKYCDFKFSSSLDYNRGYCFITQDGKVYYYYTMEL